MQSHPGVGKKKEKEDSLFQTLTGVQVAEISADGRRAQIFMALSTAGINLFKSNLKADLANICVFFQRSSEINFLLSATSTPPWAPQTLVCN